METYLHSAVANTPYRTRLAWTHGDSYKLKRSIRATSLDVQKSFFLFFREYQSLMYNFIRRSFHCNGMWMCIMYHEDIFINIFKISGYSSKKKSVQYSRSLRWNKEFVQYHVLFVPKNNKFLHTISWKIQIRGRIHDYTGSSVARIRAMWPKPNTLSWEFGRIFWELHFARIRFHCNHSPTHTIRRQVNGHQRSINL